MSEPITEQTLRQIEARQRDAATDNRWVHDVDGLLCHLGLEDVPRLIAEVRRLRGLFEHHHIEWLETEADVLERNGAGAGALCAREIAQAVRGVFGE